jgi:hypothetical protein
MSTARQLACIALISSALLSLDCGSDSSGPVVAKTIAAVEGTGQSGPTGATLAIPFRVTVTGSDGRPYPGAIVTWTVPTGAATPAPLTSATDAAGSASTVVTLGAQIGPVVVQASVPGVAPVSFNATATDPCDYIAPYTLGAVVNGALATTDCLLQDNYYSDLYGLTLGSQQGLRVTMTAGFNTWLDMYRSNQDFIAGNNDIEPGINTNSQIDVLVAPGSYILAPNSFAAFTTGPYTLSAVTRPQAVGGCEVMWITRGVTLTDSVTTGDCSLFDDTGATHYLDVVGIVAYAGSVLTIAERSTAVDALLSLYRYDPVGDSGVLVATNDDSAGLGPNAYLVVSVPLSDVYTLFIGTSGAEETGGYTLAVSSSTTAAGSAAAAPVAPLPLGLMSRMSKLSWMGRNPLPRRVPFR